MEGVHRPPGRAGRHQRLGDPQAQRDPPGRRVGPGPDHGRRLPRRRSLPRRGRARTTTRRVAAGKAVGLGLGLKNSGLGNGFKEIAKAVVRFADRRHRRGAPLLDRDGPGRAHRRPPGGGGGARRRPRPHPGASSTPPASSAPARPPAAAGTLWAPARWQAPAQAALADGCRTGRRLRGRVPGRLDATRSATASSTRSSTPRSATPPSSWSIDRETGAIEQVVAAHDVGRAVNPLLCEGQIEGAVHMGLGYALTEDFPADPTTGFPTNMTLRQPRHPAAQGRAADRRRSWSSRPSPNSPYGIKGVGEIGLVPTAGAVAAALHDARRRVARLRALPDAPRPWHSAGARPDRVTRSTTTPGLVCGHHHLYSALARGMPAPPRPPTTFLEILEQVWWRLDVALDLEMIALVGACSARSRRSSAARTAIVDHHESPERHRGQPRRHRRRLRRGRRAGGRAPTASPTATAPTAPGAGWPRTSASCGTAGRGHGRRARRLHLHATRRSRRRPAWPRDLGVGVHIHVAEGPSTSTPATRLAALADRRLAARALRPPADDHGLPGTIAHNPRSNMNNAVGYARPAAGSPTRSCSAPTASAPTCSRSSASPSPASARTTSPPRPTRRGRGWRRAGALVPEARDDRVTWSYDHVDDPWRVAFTPGVRPLDVVRRRRGACCATVGRRGSTPTRSGPRPPSRPARLFARL